MSTTDFFCPNCKTHLGTKFSISKKITDIGPAVIQCPSCSLQIKTNSKEWVEFNFLEKTRLWFEVYFYYAVLIGPVFAYTSHYLLKEKLLVNDASSAIVGFAVYLSVVLLVHFRHVAQVKASLDRTSIAQQ